MDPKPNLLFIFTDQQRHDTIAASGNHKLQVPNMNRLAAESAVFRQAYVTQPVCTPSRGSIMTGLYPHNHGALGNKSPLPVEVPTLVELLDDPNYRTGYVGKWHLGDEIFPQHGFSEWFGIDDHYRKHYSDVRDKNTASHYHKFLLANGFEPDDRDKDGFAKFSREYCAELPEAYSKPAFVGQTASDFIRRNHEQPFVLYANFFEPHTPNNSAYDNLYDRSEVDLPAAFLMEPGPDTPLHCRLNRRYFRECHGLATEEAWRDLIARYWGQISLVDKYVGVILDTLKACGLEENTIVVFTSDHGDMMGDFQMAAKSIMYQSAVRVPLMIKAPGKQYAPRTIDGPVSLVDLAPTLLQLLGWAGEASFDGKSLIPYLTGERTMSRNDVFIEWNGTNHEEKIVEPFRGELGEQIDRVFGAQLRTIITPDGWKLSLSEAGEHALYHLATDPCEGMNLYYKELFREKREELTAKIAAWQKTTRDPVRLTAP